MATAITEDANQDAEISTLTTDITAILANTPQEQFWFGDGVTQDFTLTSFTISASNSVRDFEIFQGGRRMTQDPTASDAQDFQKTGTTTFHMTVAPPSGQRLTAWKQGTSSGSSGISSTDTSVKQSKNTTGATINVGTPVEKLATGGIQPAMATSTNEFIGITLDTIAAGTFGRVKLIGENIVGAVSGLGFTSGQEIFLAASGGYTNDSTTIPGGDAIWRVGVADCADSAFTSTATDLIMFATPVLR